MLGISSLSAVLVAALATVSAPAPAQAPAAGDAPGALVVAGGGALPSLIFERAIALAGGASARLLLIPQASAREDAADRSRAAWAQRGIASIEVLDLGDVDRARGAISRADLIWIGGGSQVRLMDALPMEVRTSLRERHQAGAVLGGSSAGAAVMSSRMITGQATLDAVRAGGTELSDGLGLWPGVIVDQHFLRRRRFNRLLSAVIESPALVGIGIDESTAVVVQGSRLEVIGSSSVTVIDGRGLKPPRLDRGQPLPAPAVTLRVLTHGATLDLVARPGRRARL